MPWVFLLFSLALAPFSIAALTPDNGDPDAQINESVLLYFQLLKNNHHSNADPRGPGADALRDRAACVFSITHAAYASEFTASEAVSVGLHDLTVSLNKVLGAQWKAHIVRLIDEQNLFSKESDLRTALANALFSLAIDATPLFARSGFRSSPTYPLTERDLLWSEVATRDRESLNRPKWLWQFPFNEEVTRAFLQMLFPWVNQKGADGVRPRVRGNLFEMAEGKMVVDFRKEWEVAVDAVVQKYQLVLYDDFWLGHSRFKAIPASWWQRSQFWKKSKPASDMIIWFDDVSSVLIPFWSRSCCHTQCDTCPLAYGQVEAVKIRRRRDRMRAVVTGQGAEDSAQDND